MRLCKPIIANSQLQIMGREWLAFIGEETQFRIGKTR